MKRQDFFGAIDNEEEGREGMGGGLRDALMQGLNDYLYILTKEHEMQSNKNLAHSTSDSSLLFFLFFHLDSFPIHNVAPRRELKKA